MECECGCGQSTNVAPFSDPKKGWVKGQPLRFVRFHQSRTTKGTLDNYIVTASGCHEWQGFVRKDGYGSIGRRKVYRLAYEAVHGTIPKGLTIDHLCRNKRCMNVDHLEAVSQKVNNDRGETPSGINGRKTHCPAGHPYDEANTRIHPDARGRLHRQCRACDRAAWHARKSRFAPV